MPFQQCKKLIIAFFNFSALINCHRAHNEARLVQLPFSNSHIKLKKASEPIPKLSLRRILLPYVESSRIELIWLKRYKFKI